MTTLPRPTADVIAIDLGGTQLRTALFSGDDIQHRWSVPTPPAAPAIVDALVEQIGRARELSNDTVRAIGLSALGPVDPIAGIIRNAAAIPDFTDVPLRSLLQGRVPLPVVLVNDANAATLAEWHRGAGRDVDDFCFVTISTGIGCGFISHGRLVTGHTGAAGEFGRLQVRAAGDIDARRLEEHASGPAIALRAVQQADASEDLHGVLRRNGVITSRDVAELAARGDEVSARILSDAGTIFGESLGHIVRLLDPEIIAIGGGVSRAGEHLWDPMRASLEDSLRRDGIPMPRVVPAQLQDDAGLHGASIAASDLRSQGGDTPEFLSARLTGRTSANGQRRGL